MFQWLTYFVKFSPNFCELDVSSMFLTIHNGIAHYCSHSRVAQRTTAYYLSDARSYSQHEHHVLVQGDVL